MEYYTMNLNDMNNDSDRKTIYVRKNGSLKAVRVKRSHFDYDKKQEPMFPISKDRNKKDD